MKNPYRIFWSMVIFFGMNTLAFSQIWPNGEDKFKTDINKRYNFYEIQESFNKYWEGKEINLQTPKNQRGGWMQFKRWEWFWEQRTFPDGNFPDPMHTYNELMKLRNQKSSDNEILQGSDWENIGPETNTGGYNGLGRLNCIEEDPDYDGTTNRTIWVGSASGGLWKTTDDGATWTTKTDKLPSLGISGICINPSNKNIMYIATGDGDVADTYSVGVLKSTDGGENWNTTGLNWTIQNNRVIRKLIMHPSNYDILYAATSIGIFKTTNGGNSWTQMSISLTYSSGFWDIEFKPGDPNTLYATSTWEIVRTTNAGTNWSILTSGLPSANANTYRAELTVSAHDANYIYAVYGYYNWGGGTSANNYGLYGVYRSTNSGTNWTTLSNWDNDQINLLGWESSAADSGGQAFYDLDIVASPTDKNVVFIGGVNVWRTTNSGSSWSCVAHWYGQGGRPEVHADHHHLRFAGTSNRLYSGHDGGIDRTTNNGSSWTWLGSGLKITQFYRLGVSQTNSNFVIAGSQDNGTKLKKNAEWFDVIGGDGMECIIDYTDTNYMWGALYYGQMRRSTNAGKNWSGLNRPETNGAWVTPYVLHPTNPQIMYAGYRNVWVSTNRGTNWSSLSSFSNGSLTLLHVAPSNTNHIYAGYGSILNRTTNGGTNWSSITLPTSRSITYMAIHPDNPNRIWATFSGYTSGQKVYYSTNGGTSWTNITGNLPNIPVNTIVYQKNRDNRVYVGTDLGVFYRDDKTTNWIEYNQSLPNVIVNELEIHQADGILFAATYGRGVWKVQLPGEYFTLIAPTLNHPLNNSTNIPIADTLKWQSVQGAETYQVQVSINSSFGTTIIDTSVTDTTYFLSNASLNYSTNYYWRVRAKSTGQDGPWSSTWLFTTEQVPLVAPVLTNPSDNATNIDLNINLTWNAVQGAQGYQIQVSHTSNFDNPFTDLILGNIYLALLSINPEYSTTYYWRVRAQRGLENGPWANHRQFTTKPIPLVAPELVSPADNASDVTISSALSWNSVAGADNYTIQISPNSSFNELYANITQSGLNYSISNFSPDYSTEYHWRVRSKRGSEDGPWSESRMFITEPIPLVAPALTNPADNDDDVALDENLAWNSVQGADNYQIQIALSSSFSSTLADVNQSGQSYSLSNISPDYSTEYFWRVRAKRGSENGPWASYRQFTTMPIPLVAPVLTAPDNNATDVQLSAILSWNSVQGADNYQVQVSLNSNFTTTLANVTQTGLNYAISNYSPEYSTTYYWRVRPKRGSEDGPWATYRQFTTMAIPLVAPILNNPNDNSTNIPLNENLAWNSVQGADNYQIQIALSSSFSSTLADVNQSGQSYSLSNISPDYSTEYFWRVRAKRGSENGPWASYRQFTTMPIPLVAPVLTAPDNNATDVQLSAILSWNSVQGADNYQVQVSLNSNFTTTLANVTQTGLNYAISNYSPEYSTTYYWRVRPKRGSEDGPWATYRQFTTMAIPLVAPILNNPNDNSTNIPLDENLAWNSVQGADNYQIQIALSSSFSSTLADATQSGQSYSLSNISPDYSTEYFWRVRAKRGSENGPWASYRQFTTMPVPLVAPVLTAPDNNATKVMLDADLTWQSVSGAESYELQLSRFSNFSSHVINSNVGNVLLFDLGSVSMNFNTLYYWRVRAIRGSDSGPYSTTYTFTTRQVLQTPASLYPPHQSKNIMNSEIARWSEVEDAEKYHVQFATSSNFSTILYENANLTDTMVAISLLNLNINQNVIWRVRAINSLENSNWSTLRTFSAYPSSASCDAKALVCGPYISDVTFGTLQYQSGCDWGYADNYASQTLNVNKKQTYQFSASGTNTTANSLFKLWIDWNGDNDFDDEGESLAIIGTPGSGPFTANITVPSSAITGKVRARMAISNDNISSYCGIIQNGEFEDFALNIAPAFVVAPDLISPLNNAKDIKLTAEFVWDAIEDALSYNIQISDDQQFNNIVYQTNTASTSVTLSSGILSYRKTYYWRVNTVGSQNTSDYSTARKFDSEKSVPDDWTYISDSEISSVVRVPIGADIKIGNRDIDKGDAIGLFFDDNGTLKCSGYGIWNNETLDITVWGDDTKTSEKDGYDDDEAYKFKTWDSQLDLVYPSTAKFESGPEVFQNDSLSILSSLESSIKYQTISLSSGWNLISSYITPINASMTDVWNDIKDDVVIVKDGLGKTYLPAFDINGIGNWKLFDGYQVYMSVENDIVIGGNQAIPENEDIELSSGWSLISYLRNSNMNAVTAFATLTNSNSLVIAKDNFGRTYIPMFNINGIGNLLPGQGYQVYLSSAATLTYPANQQGRIAPLNNFTNTAADILEPAISNTGDNMTIILELDKFNSRFDIGVFNQDNLLAGSAKVIDNRAYITVWNFDKNNNSEHKYFELRAYDKLKHTYMNINLESVKDLFSNSDVDIITYRTNFVYFAKGSIDFDFSSPSISAYPNPFNDKCEIAVFLPEPRNIELILYNSAGKEVYKINHSVSSSGLYNFIIEAGILSSGEYLVVVNYGSKTLSEKIILSR
ncbi:MAG: T9SS type A sorting domain-containing protein [Ignavibacteriae bacterium]|nr:T9SS type A sorting domain-containing protein [Ignavibacteriota bacterium]